MLVGTSLGALGLMVGNAKTPFGSRSAWGAAYYGANFPDCVRSRSATTPRTFFTSSSLCHLVGHANYTTESPTAIRGASTSQLLS